jgi:hypothetical protein
MDQIALDRIGWMDHPTDACITWGTESDDIEGKCQTHGDSLTLRVCRSHRNEQNKPCDSSTNGEHIISFLYVCIHTCMFVWMYNVWMCACMHACINVWMNERMSEWMCVWMYVCNVGMNAWICMQCMYVMQWGLNATMLESLRR